MFVFESNDGVTDAAGAGTIVIGPVPQGKLWYVERVTSSVAGATAASHLLYRNQRLAPNLEDVSPILALAWAFIEWPPIVLQGGESIVIAVDGADPAVDYSATMRGRQFVVEQSCIQV